MKTLFDHTFYFVLLIVAAYAGYLVNKHRSWFTTRGAFAVTMFGAILTWGFYAGFSFGHPDGAFVLSFGAGAWLVRVNPYYVALLLKPFGWMFTLLRRTTQLIAAPFKARAQSDQQTHPTSSFLLVLLHTAETFFSDMEQLFAKYAERHAQYHAEAHDSAPTG